MKKNLPQSVIYNVLIIIILFCGVVIASPKFGFIKMYVVQSGSMEPKLPVGSLIIVKSVDKYLEGDIITFRTSNDRSTTTHRILEIKEEQNTVHYVTKGDANETPDSNLVFDKDIIGSVAYAIPYIGYPVSFAKTDIGFMLMIVIPATLIVYKEILAIKEEAKQRRKKKKVSQDKTIKLNQLASSTVKNWFKNNNSN